MLTVLRAVDRWVLRLSLGTAMALLALMSVITFWQVLTRFVLERPSTWSEVTARSLMIWMVYLGLVACLRAGSLISVDLLIARVPPASRKFLAIAIAGVTLGVLGVMVWYGWAMTERTARQTIAGVSDPFFGQKISIGFIYAAIPVGAALSIVATLARLAEELTGHLVHRQGPATHDV
ncbi:TRAP transporter small permease [Aurantimonas marianensis]|uniref:TRAP transporter small permease protein n=1 Tax=Aurantimonas marianensis TaxID=2920428 RepID=A0A9X2H6Y1_9HYPH|nr:TRAP transporter small permease [Aurantimonas marianensis]MCP3055336.1 TRAP transporter small permease [Aurantimonas marianensis]